MNRSEKIAAVVKLENEIEQLKRFEFVLKTSLVAARPFAKAFIKVSIRKFLIAIPVVNRKIEIEIPDKLIAEIAAKCKVWIKELENSANIILKDD